MLHIYTQFFEFLLDNEQQIREQIGEDWRQLYSVLQQDPSLATPDPASLEEFEKYLRRVIGYSLQSPIRGLGTAPTVE